MGKRERARRQAARAEARAASVLPSSDLAQTSDPTSVDQTPGQMLPTKGRYSGHGRDRVFEPSSEGFSVPPKDTVKLRPVREDIEAASSKTAPRRKKGRGGKGASRRSFDTTTWLIRGFIALTAAFAIAFALQSFGLFAPAPLDLSTIEDVATQVKQNDPVGTRVPMQPASHVPDSQKITTYSTTPPTSGSHWGAPATWGIKDRQEPNERTVHNLEHGGIVISHSGLSEAELTSLKSLVGGLNKAGFRKIVVQPYADLKDGRVVLTSWGWMSRLGEVDQKAIFAFVKAHYEGKDAPEPKMP